METGWCANGVPWNKVNIWPWANYHQTAQLKNSTKTLAVGIQKSESDKRQISQSGLGTNHCYSASQ
jgi:hypothetical protein